ncbi:hypothetical protein FRC08_003288 [Ceratobasidium sp. 394]|nr:hypothetical protein FRC08_003288 [Ceratobasidium sp. 394]
MDMNASNQPPDDEGWIYNSRQVYNPQQVTATPVPVAYSHAGGPSQPAMQPASEPYPVPTQPTFFATGPPSQQMIGQLQPNIYPTSVQTDLVEPTIAQAPLYSGPFPKAGPTIFVPAISAPAMPSTQPSTAQIQGNDPDC